MSNPIPNKGKFNHPEGYFESFKERLDMELQLNELLGDTPDSGFKTPEQYFEQSQERFTTVAGEKNRVIALNPIGWLWIAASIAAIILITFNIPMDNRGSELDLALLEDFVMLDDTNISVLELSELLDDQEFDNLSSALFPDDDSYIEFLNESTDEFLNDDSEIYDFLIE